MKLNYLLVWKVVEEKLKVNAVKVNAVKVNAVKVNAVKEEEELVDDREVVDDPHGIK